MSHRSFKSHSSYGEDAMLNGVLEHLSFVTGKNMLSPKTYIDLGSFHPIEYSNTFFLYNNGWTGTLVEPNIYFNQDIKENRPNDMLLNCAVGLESGKKDFYFFSNSGSSNTTSLEYAQRIAESQKIKDFSTLSVSVKTIKEIIDEHIKNFRSVPFFISIDIEGSDLDVISDYPINIRIPFIMIEDISNGIFTNSPIREVLKTKGYLPIATTFVTTLYVDAESSYFLDIQKIGKYDQLEVSR